MTSSKDGCSEVNGSTNAVGDVLVGLPRIQQYLTDRWRISVSREAIRYWMRKGLLWQPPRHDDSHLVIEDGNRIKLRCIFQSGRICCNTQCTDAFIRRAGDLKTRGRR